MYIDWSDEDLKKAIKAYFKMLKYEQNHTDYVKAEMNKELQADLPGRTKGSIEYRWRNISSVLDDHQIKFVSGYLPAKNVGDAVKERIWKIINELGLLK